MENQPPQSSGCFECLKKFILCRCFERSHKETLTEKSKKKWKELANKANKDENMDLAIIALLKLYNDQEDVFEFLQRCRINPDYSKKKAIRTDLEFYIPQLTNFMVFHEDSSNKNLTNFLHEVSVLDHYFAHLYYWYLSSLMPEMDPERGQAITDDIIDFCSDEEAKLQLFQEEYELFNTSIIKRAESQEQAERLCNEIAERRVEANQLIMSYKANDLENCSVKNFEIRGQDIELKVYESPFDETKENEYSNIFTSTLMFYEDLYRASQEIMSQADKPTSLKSLLYEINKSLPSYVYVPFFKDMMRYYAVLNIVTEETRVFSTKERAPFYICLELFKPQEDLKHSFKQIFNIEEHEVQSKFQQFFTWAKDKAKFLKKDKKKDSKSTVQPESSEEAKMDKFSQYISKPVTLKKAANNPTKTSDTSSHRGGHNRHEQSFRSLIEAPSMDQKEIDNLMLDAPSSRHKSTIGKFLPKRKMTEEDEYGLSVVYNQESPTRHDSSHMSQSLIQNTSNPSINREGLAKEGYVSSILSDSAASKFKVQHKTSNESRGSPSPKISNRRNSTNSTSSEGSQHNASYFKHGRKESSDNETEITTFKGNHTLKEPLIDEEEKEDDDSDDNDTRRKTADFGTVLETNKSIKIKKEDLMNFFGEDSMKQEQRIRQSSPFSQLKSWKLVHMIVKGGADIKEEQFAVQLIYQFDQIFKREKLKLLLRPYEIISLNHEFGLVEMVKDAITIDKLKRQLREYGIQSMNDFFTAYYGKKADKARRKFCRSLAAYSVICYLLQIKDRHNQNILLHKEGYLFHIDFGFFFTNAPGKALEFEGPVPFKLLNEYVEVLGGQHSKMFNDFRNLFLKGFKAARKHQDQILTVVKMMYSGQGEHLPCFRGGDRAIEELIRRFNPPNVTSDIQLRDHCYGLVNKSLDNWRAKCYDKYQYYFQGIFY